MHEGQRRLLAQAVPGLRRSQANGGEDRLDGVRRPKALPVPRLEVVEGEQLLPVSRQALSGFRVFRPLREIGVFPSTVKSRYPVDIIWKNALLGISFGTRLRQSVIKTQADEL